MWYQNDNSNVRLLSLAQSVWHKFLKSVLRRATLNMCITNCNARWRPLRQLSWSNSQSLFEERTKHEEQEQPPKYPSQNQHRSCSLISLFAVHRVRWWHQCRVSSVTCFALWWDSSTICDLKPLPQLTQKMIGAEPSGMPWQSLWSFWNCCAIFSSMWLFPWWMACVRCCQSCARVCQWYTVMCVAFRCRLTTSLYRSRCPPRRRFPRRNVPVGQTRLC